MKTRYIYNINHVTMNEDSLHKEYGNFDLFWWSRAFTSQGPYVLILQENIYVD